VKFEYDEKKSQINKEKHKIDFVEVYYPRKTKQHFENSYFEYDKIRIIKRG